MEERYRAVTPLAAIMKSSIRSLARLAFSVRELADRVAVEDRPRLEALEGKGPVNVPEALHALGHLVLQAQILVEARHGRHGRRRRPPSSHAATLL